MIKMYDEYTMENVYIDFDTPNISFLKMAAILNEKGIDNYFFLALHNKKLRGVDPYDPNLTVEQKAMIFRECAENRWYFYREVFRVSESGASTDVGGGSPFLLNRGNLAYLWAMSLNISAMMILPRQTGKTWAAIADYTWVYQFVRGMSLLHFNKNQPDANMNLRRIQDAIAMLPTYLQHSSIENIDSSDRRKIKNNEKSMRNIINSSIEAMPSAGNEAKADSMARGKTASKIWWDEMGFIFFNETMWGASTPAYEKARELAIKNGAPYALSITTTPGDLASPHGAFCHQMMESCIPFQEEMYGWKPKKLFDIINNTPDKTNIVFIQFSYLQLGESEEWYLERFKSMGNPIKARREYLLEWVNTNGNSPFDPDDIEVIGDLSNQRALAVNVYKINKYFNLYEYSEYHGPKPVLISVDVSGGLGRDSSAVVVVNPETLMPMAFFKSNMIPSDQLKKLLVTIVNKRYPHCVLTVENNSVGTPLLNELKETSISRVLYKEKKKKQIDMGVNSATKKKMREVVEYGHNTNNQSRGQMMEMLESIVHNSPAHLGFPEIYDELKFLELRNGRIDHGSASHDDSIMSYLGALWVVRYGTGLKNKGIYYTISEGSEDDDFHYDTSGAFAAAKKIILDKGGNDEDDLVHWMCTPQDINDSGTLAAKERAMYHRTLDEVDDILEEDDPEYSVIDSISDSTQRLLLKNSYAMLSNSPDGDLESLLRPSFVDANGQSDWSDLYSY